MTSFVRGAQTPEAIGETAARCLGIPERGRGCAAAQRLVEGVGWASVAAIQHGCPKDPARLRRLAVRFAKPITPGQTITTSLWDAGNRALAYETVADSGDVVI